MADPPPATARAGRARSRFRPWLRAIHRDVGYSAVGLTVVYAASGLAVNHIAQWDPNFRNTTVVHELGAPLPDDDAEASRRVLARLGIAETPREVYREGDELEVLFDHRTLHVAAATGRVVDEDRRPRPLIRAANWLHLNRGKKAWTYFADAYAAGLLFLALSGLFMLPGKKGLLGRGAVFVLLGAAIPIVYVTLAKG
ncbi:MAG TPA: PepSY-associated TM helix domain-containing protein [Polyangiaceae bacterium]|nr:PepSY-associated TM helix domain-containing protein [Polyangiaceae bacterium]